MHSSPHVNGFALASNVTHCALLMLSYVTRRFDLNSVGSHSEPQVDFRCAVNCHSICPADVFVAVNLWSSGVVLGVGLCRAQGSSHPMAAVDAELLVIMAAHLYHTLSASRSKGFLVPLRSTGLKCV